MRAKSKIMRRLKASLLSLGTLIACSGYVFLWFRYDLDSTEGVAVATLGGIVALTSLAYSAVSPSAQRLVTKVLLGSGALVATVCGGFFIYYSWTEQSLLQESGIYPIFILLCLFALGVAFGTWFLFCTFTVLEGHESDDVA